MRLLLIVKKTATEREEFTINLNNMDQHNQNRIDFYEDVMSLLKQYNLTKDDLLEVFGLNENKPCIIKKRNRGAFRQF